MSFKREKKKIMGKFSSKFVAIADTTNDMDME